ncbi:hypothetical protein BDW62DRAFT_219972 [Aspergillus aurantiobrunneus]
MSRTKHGNSDSSSLSPTHTFPLAHPPPKATTKSRQCIRLSSRLLLQIQQLHSPSATRAIPVLELYRPSTFGKSIARRNGSRKIHGRDLYLTQSERFAHLGSTAQTRNGHLNRAGNGNGTKPRSRSGGSGSASGSASGASPHRNAKSSGDSSGDENERRRFSPRRRRKTSAAESASGSGSEENDTDEDDVVAVIHTSPKSRARSRSNSRSKDAETAAAGPDAQLFFPVSGWTCEASSPSPGRYRFRRVEGDGDSEHGQGEVFEWERRPPSRSGEKGEEDRFVLGVSTSAETHKRPWLGQLTRRGIQVGGLEAWQGELRALMGDGGEGLYTMILTMGVWVAWGEGWVG